MQVIEMKHIRLKVFISVLAAHLLVIIGFGVSLTLKNLADNTSSYMELADFQYAGDPPDGDGKPPAPTSAAKPAVAKAESFDPSQEEKLSGKDELAETIGQSEASSEEYGTGGVPGGTGDGSALEYLPLQKISQMPVIAEKSIRERLSYPEMARRGGIEGRVFLELFVDLRGKIRKIAVLKEDPVGFGFADAAVSAFDGATCVPAKVNGQAVSVRFRYPIRFSLNSGS